MYIYIYNLQNHHIHLFHQIIRTPQLLKIKHYHAVAISNVDQEKDCQEKKQKVPFVFLEKFNI